MKPRLFLDEDIHVGLAQAPRKRGHDVVHAQEMERKGRSDREQLAFSAEQERCLVSFNVKDFVILHNEYVASDRDHWGIIVSRQIPIGEAMRGLLRFLTPESVGFRWYSNIHP